MKKRLLELIQYLESDLIERAVPVRLSLLAALSGEHLLLLGPPGTAKSELARRLHRVFANANYFERLLTRFSVPEELFGPLSIRALEEDRYQRLTRNYLPDASVAFIDEIFKSNSAILNSLLTILNEREFDNGSERIKTPLICVIAASNEMPEESGLDALYDRFLIRYQVSPVSDKGFSALLKIPTLNLLPDMSCLELLNIEDIKYIQEMSKGIYLHKQAQMIMQRFRQYLKEQSIYISDRRWRQALKLLQVSAFTSEQKFISTWDCTLLVHIMWQSPEQQNKLNSWFINELNLDVDSAVTRLQKLLLIWESKLAEDQKKFTQKTNSQGELLYRTPAGVITTQHENVFFAEREGESLYLAPPDQDDRTNKNRGYTLEQLERIFFDKSYKQTHINGRWVDVQNYINNTQNKLVERRIYEPVVDAFCFSREYVSNQLNELEEVLKNVELICKGFQHAVVDLNEVVKNNIWHFDGILMEASDAITTKIPKLIGFQQRLRKLKKINSELLVKL